MKLEQILTLVLFILGLIFLLCIGLIIMLTPAWAVDVPDQPVKVVVTNPAPVNVTNDNDAKAQAQAKADQKQTLTGGTQTVHVGGSKSISSAVVSPSGDGWGVTVGPLGLGFPSKATNAGKWVGIAAVTGANPTAMACTYRRYRRAYPHLCGVAVPINRAAITDQTYHGSKGRIAPVVTTRQAVPVKPVGRGGDR